MNRLAEGHIKILRVLLQIAGIAYPFAVFFLIRRIPLWAFVILALAVGGLQLGRIRHMHKAFDRRHIMLAWGVLAIVLTGIYCSNAIGAVKAYPVLVSLGFAAFFGLSLRYPPTVIERIARLTTPDLPPEGVHYTRQVTWVWFSFLILNAAIALSLALWGTLAQWTLWCGLLSYIAMGILFAGEYLVRRRVQP